MHFLRRGVAFAFVRPVRAFLVRITEGDTVAAPIV